MSKQGHNGWAGLIELDDAPAAAEPEDKTPPDAVPAFSVPPPSAPTLPAAPAARTLRLPVPGGSGASAPTRGAEPARASLQPLVDDLVAPPPAARASERARRAPPADSGFSGADFVERLGSAGATPAAPRPSVWREYRELIVTGALGVVLLAGAIAWRLSGPSDAGPEPERTPVVAPSAPAPPAEAAARAATAVAPAGDPTAPAVAPATDTPSPTPTPVKAAQPMLTIMTVPPGADIEIDGEFVGRSPFVSVVPLGTRDLRVTASLEGYADGRATLVPNEGGHFSATLTLVATPNARKKRH